MKKALQNMVAIMIIFATLLGNSLALSDVETDIKYEHNGRCVVVPAKTCGEETEDGFVYTDFLDPETGYYYDFYNATTHEYFRWLPDNADASNAVSRKSKTVDKEFEFYIRFSVSSSSFTINGETCFIVADANVVTDINGREEIVDGYDDLTYGIVVKRGLTKHTFTTTVEDSIYDSFEADPGKSYTMTVAVESDRLRGTAYYLSGSGEIYHYE